MNCLSYMSVKRRKGNNFSDFFGFTMEDNFYHIRKKYDLVNHNYDIKSHNYSFSELLKH